MFLPSLPPYNLSIFFQKFKQALAQKNDLTTQVGKLVENIKEKDQELSMLPKLMNQNQNLSRKLAAIQEQVSDHALSYLSATACQINFFLFQKKKKKAGRNEKIVFRTKNSDGGA